MCREEEMTNFFGKCDNIFMTFDNMILFVARKLHKQQEFGHIHSSELCEISGVENNNLLVGKHQGRCVTGTNGPVEKRDYRQTLDLQRAGVMGYSKTENCFQFIGKVFFTSC